jgi:hypothetical protein
MKRSERERSSPGGRNQRRVVAPTGVPEASHPVLKRARVREDIKRERVREGFVSPRWRKPIGRLFKECSIAWHKRLNPVGELVETNLSEAMR